MKELGDGLCKECLCIPACVQYCTLANGWGLAFMYTWMNNAMSNGLL